jgi:hypothetical protein
MNCVELGFQRPRGFGYGTVNFGLLPLTDRPVLRTLLAHRAAVHMAEKSQRKKRQTVLFVLTIDTVLKE